MLILILLEQYVWLERSQYSLLDLFVVLKCVLQLLEHIKDEAVTTCVEVSFISMCQFEELVIGFRPSQPIVLDYLEEGMGSEDDLNLVKPKRRDTHA